MKVLILITMIIVFISVFFIFFTFDVVVKNYVSCSFEGDCGAEVSGVSFLFGLSIIGVFIVLSGGAIYIVVRIISKPRVPYSAKRL
jgi:hypothetical protein